MRSKLLQIVGAVLVLSLSACHKEHLPYTDGNVGSGSSNNTGGDGTNDERGPADSTETTTVIYVVNSLGDMAGQGYDLVVNNAPVEGVLPANRPSEPINVVPGYISISLVNQVGYTLTSVQKQVKATDIYTLLISKNNSGVPVLQLVELPKLPFAETNALLTQLGFGAKPGDLVRFNVLNLTVGVGTGNLKLGSGTLLPNGNALSTLVDLPVGTVSGVVSGVQGSLRNVQLYTGVMSARDILDLISRTVYDVQVLAYSTLYGLTGQGAAFDMTLGWLRDAVLAPYVKLVGVPNILSIPQANPGSVYTLILSGDAKNPILTFIQLPETHK